MIKMKRSILLLCLACGLEAFAQSEGISYQAVIVSERPVEVPGVDITSAYLAEVEITLRFTITDATGGTTYQETQATRTDAYGMVNVIIGQGTTTAASAMAFDQIDWDGAPRDLVVEVAQSGADFEAFSAQPLLFVPYAYHRTITATGTLTVDGATALHGHLTVDGITDLNSTLFVDGDAYMNNALDVDGPFTVLSASDLHGQVTIDAGTSGTESSYDAYALRVQGTQQGMALKLNGGVTESRNFITFFDGAGSAKGRIEGQTLSELHNSFRFIWDVTMGGFAEAFVVAEGIACSAQLDLGEAGVMVANATVAGAQWVELTYNMETNVGVSFLSGGADYAEWLERLDPEERIDAGDVVGLFGGRISKRTAGAQQVLAISTRPIVVGNLPAEGKEHLYERVGFIGQVLVKVAGQVRVGDLIVASGADDGFAVAMAEKDVPTELLDQVIGVAWEERAGGAGLVNVAVGMGRPGVARRVAQLEDEMAELREGLARLQALVEGKEVVDDGPSAATGSGTPASGTVHKPAAPKVASMDAERFEEWLALVGPAFDDAMADVRARFTTAGSDYQRFSDVKLLVDSPREALRAMHGGTFMPTFWKAMNAR